MMSVRRSSSPPVNDYDITILSVWVGTLLYYTACIAEYIIIIKCTGEVLNSRLCIILHPPYQRVCVVKPVN